jgi:NAD(P) transhydrogenase subunit alpha
MDVVQIMMVLYIFILAIFVGFELISKVPPTLHTPLMSGANAISGITILGATIIAGKYTDWSHWTGILGFFAVLFGALNVYGGYIVTDRMLRMFKSKKDKEKIK